MKYIFCHHKIYKVFIHISHNISKTNQLNLDNNILLKNDNYKLALVKQKVKSFKIQDDIKLDNIELKFNDSKKRKNALSFGFSVEIPISKNNSKLINEKVKLLALKNKINEDKINLVHKIAILKMQIHDTINYFAKIDDQINTGTLSSKRKHYTPKLLLKIKKKNIKLEKAKAKTFYQLLEQYLTLLYITDTVGNSNLKNMIQNSEAL